MKIKVIRKDGNTWEECTEYEKAQALGGYQDKQMGSLHYRMGKVCMPENSPKILYPLSRFKLPLPGCPLAVRLPGQVVSITKTHSWGNSKVYTVIQNNSLATTSLGKTEIQSYKQCL